MIAESFDLGGASHVGRRDHNEDAFLIDRGRDLILVADGLGGYAAGEVASQLACETLAASLDRETGLAGSVHEANLEIARVANERGTQGMGTTVVAAAFAGPAYEVVWVGDSRAYLFDGDLHLITRDHSLVEAMVARGEITPEEAPSHKSRNVIMQALGLVPREKLELGTNSGVLKPGERLLLCSDGLSGVVSNAAIAATLAGDATAQVMAEQLVQQAVEGGGSDNITAVVLCAPDTPDGQTPRTPSLVWTYHTATQAVEYHRASSGLRKVKPRAAPADAPAPTPAPVDPVAPAEDRGSGDTRLWGVIAFLLVMVALLVLALTLRE